MSQDVLEGSENNNDFPDSRWDLNEKPRVQADTPRIFLPRRAKQKLQVPFCPCLELERMGAEVPL